MEYYNTKIQLDKAVIEDILANIEPGTKMLVFGLGHDSKMWYQATNKNTIFVENDEAYIQLNVKDISSQHIVKYQYNTTCQRSRQLSDAEISAFTVPEQLSGPFDIILIDGPVGVRSESPGRLLPCYWSRQLIRPGGLIYIDDSIRPLESFLIEKYFSQNAKTVFKGRDQCTKIQY